MVLGEYALVSFPHITAFASSHLFDNSVCKVKNGHGIMMVESPIYARPSVQELGTHKYSSKNAR